MRYQWEIVQTGELTLRPDSSVDSRLEHVCSAVLIWPEGRSPGPDNCLLTDPCFAGRDTRRIQQRLGGIGINVPVEIGLYHVTHSHLDHEPFWPDYTQVMRGVPYDDGWHDLQRIHCPGHAADQYALAFVDTDDRRVWVVGDAVLDEEWLLAWAYYWPNGYTRDEIIATWTSIGMIIQDADVVIPGHGAPISVTPTLVQQLIEGFPQADYAGLCPHVVPQLQQRLEK